MFACAASSVRRVSLPSDVPRGSIEHTAAIRLIVVALALVVMLVAAPSAVVAQSCWSPPVDAEVTEPFRAPLCLWCAGHRGLEYGSTAGQPVRAVTAGVVTFSGPVVGVEYLVIEHPDGRRATYGNVDSDLVAGDVVVAGVVVGSTRGPLHFGVRDGDTYLDPAAFIGQLTWQPRLVPLDGSSPRPGRPARLSCAAGSGL